MKRIPWDNLPDVWIHASETSVKHHHVYQAAKSGDPDAAYELVYERLNLEVVKDLYKSFDHLKPILVSAHAVEGNGVNAIPEALADVLSESLHWPVDSGIIQTNIVAHTGADGFSRLARQACFEGEVLPKQPYLLVDDFIGQGGTLANLRSHLLCGDAHVVGAVVLTGKPHSAKLALTPDTYNLLRQKHGTELENWWQCHFGFGLDCLTESEARYLLNTPNVDRIRDKIAQAVQG